MGYCASTDGRDMYIFSEADLAYSSDAGESWNSVRGYGRLPYFCGFNGDQLWLKHKRLHMYRADAAAVTGEDA